jgi:hypothetical protein
LCIKINLFLCRDNIPAILLAEWDLSTEYFDEDFLSGIMPVLFARDPRAAEAGIKANPETAMKDLDKLNRIFFIPESVELDGALKIVKRARLGDVDFVFKRKNLDRVFEPEPFIQGKTQIIKFRYSTNNSHSHTQDHLDRDQPGPIRRCSISQVQKILDNVKEIIIQNIDKKFFFFFFFFFKH